MMEIDVKKVFDEAIAPWPEARWACCELDFSSWKKDYNYGLFVYAPYDELMTLRKYDEKKQFALRCRLFDRVHEIGRAVEKAAKAAGIPFLVPPGSRDHMSLPYMSTLSNKYLGVRSGVGWIGKNDLLITYEYGPRIWTFGAVFRADHMDVKKPVAKSECGDCDLCIRSCPYKNFTGNTWHDGVPREDLVNYHNCSMKRFLLGQRLHLDRKFMCARCLLACPHGQDRIREVAAQYEKEAK